jgi:hypothetical protein
VGVTTTVIRLLLQQIVVLVGSDLGSVFIEQCVG